MMVVPAARRRRSSFSKRKLSRSSSTLSLSLVLPAHRASLTHAAADDTSCALRGRIESDVHSLELLHSVRPWIPGPLHVRPDVEMRARKEAFLAHILTEYHCLGDYVKDTVFGMKMQLGSADGLYTAAPVPAAKDELESFSLSRRRVHRLVPNPFPYKRPSAQHCTHHMVMWYAWPGITAVSSLFDQHGGGGGSTQKPRAWVNESVVNEDISAGARQLLGHDNFEYAWYENPKQSMAGDPAGLYHVQVFLVDHNQGPK